MNEYKVVFIRKSKEEGKSDELLGTLTIDDNGTNERFTLAAKAFRVCSPVLLNADVLQITRIK